MPARAYELAGDKGTRSHADESFHVSRRRVSLKCLGMYTFLPNEGDIAGRGVSIVPFLVMRYRLSVRE